MDLLQTLRTWSDRSVHVVLDLEGLQGIENPVNLNMHHHEELVARTSQELESYNTIVTQDFPQRLESLRTWYRECILALEKEMEGSDSTLSELNFDTLCEDINSAKTVRFFGGSSLGLLDRLIDQGAAGKMQCFLQAVRKPYPRPPRELC